MPHRTDDQLDELFNRPLDSKTGTLLLTWRMLLGIVVILGLIAICGGAF